MIFFKKKFVAVPAYYKEKSDMQPVLLKTLFSFGEIQFSHSSSKKLSSILNLIFAKPKPKSYYLHSFSLR